MTRGLREVSLLQGTDLKLPSTQEPKTAHQKGQLSVHYQEAAKQLANTLRGSLTCAAKLDNIDKVCEHEQPFCQHPLLGLQRRSYST